MKIFHVVEEISDKNNSIKTITKILLNIKFSVLKIVTPYPFKNARFEKVLLVLRYSKIFLNLNLKYIIFKFQ